MTSQVNSRQNGIIVKLLLALSQVKLIQTNYFLTSDILRSQRDPNYIKVEICLQGTNFKEITTRPAHHRKMHCRCNHFYSSSKTTRQNRRKSRYCFKKYFHLVSTQILFNCV